MGECPPRPPRTALRQRAVERHVETCSAKRLQTHRLTAVQTGSLFVSPLREEIPSRATQSDSAGAALAFSKILEPQEVVSASDLYGTILGTQGVAAQPVNLTTTQFSHPAFVSVDADGRPRQHPQNLSAWLVRGFPRAAGKRKGFLSEPP